MDKSFQFHFIQVIRRIAVIQDQSARFRHADGKYIVTKMCYEDRKCDPDKDVTIESISVNDKAVYINGGDFYLIAGKPIEGSTKYTQEYDSQKGTWGEIGSYVVPHIETVPNGTAD